MSTLVTGLEGFAGYHLLNTLPESFFPVHGAGLAEPMPEAKDKAEYHTVNVTDTDAVEALIAAVKPDNVIHLAAVSNVGVSLREPAKTFSVNVGGTVNLLSALQKHSPAARVLLVGSGEVYGNTSNEEDYSETDSCAPESPYAASKLAMETAGISFHNSFGLNVRISRSFNHTGPYQPAHFIFSHAAKKLVQIKRGEMVPVLELGNLDIYRDFMDVRDVTSAYIAILEKGEPGGIYNVSAGRALTLREMIQILIKQSGLDVEVKVDPSRVRANEVMRLVGNNKKLREKTGWKPRVPLEQTFGDLFSYWEKKLAIDN